MIIFLVKSAAIKILLLSVVSLLLLSCNKDELGMDYELEIVDSESETNFQQIYFIDELTGFIVGGQRSTFGSIYKTTDGGESWELNYSTNETLYAVNFFNDSVGYACGESLILLKTFDQGITWENYQFPYYPNYLFDAPFKKIDILNDTTIYLSGGWYFDRGLIARSTNGGTWWDWKFFDYELSSSHFFSHDHGIFGGYGHFTITKDGANSFEVVDFNGDFFTSMYFLDAEVGFASGYDGGIYKTTNSGNSWEDAAKSNKLLKQRKHLNDVFMVNSQKGIAVGNNGAITLTNDGGNNWQEYKINEELNFYSIYHSGNGKLSITCSEGKILKINI